MMNYVTLGRTGLHVSVMGLGGGGHSRLGQQTGGSDEQSVAIVRRALDLGINFFDTAEAYGTELLIGSALGGKTRDEVTLSTKKSMTLEDRLITPEELVQGLEGSLSRLGTDRVEIYHLHGVRVDHYDYARETLVPALFKLRDQGKIRFLGITEAFASDPTHQMMARAVLDDCWDVVMVGFNILNQSARERIFPHTRQRGIGVLDMFAVRRAFSRPDKLRQTVAELLQRGVISSTTITETRLDREEPLAFLLSDGSAQSLPDAAYRFCRAEPGIHVVLSGTGNLRHLEENVHSLLRPPLPEKHRARLIRMFAGIDSVSGQ
jgi:aryl-alcohol dehydrogenase-like predicted oxidoreductase